MQYWFAMKLVSIAALVVVMAVCSSPHSPGGREDPGIDVIVPAPVPTSAPLRGLFVFTFEHISVPYPGCLPPGKGPHEISSSAGEIRATGVTAAPTLSGFLAGYTYLSRTDDRLTANFVLLVAHDGSGLQSPQPYCYSARMRAGPPGEYRVRVWYNTPRGIPSSQLVQTR
jgi:hypothetical protein